MTAPTKPGSWLNLYIERYKKGEIGIEDILEEENERRKKQGKRLLKYRSVKRALNLAGLSTTVKSKEIKEKRGRRKDKSKVKEKKATKTGKPCYDCEHFTKGVCVYPKSLFEHYPTLQEFMEDFDSGNCKLKLH